MKQITLRVPDDLHELATAAAETQQQSLNSFAMNALLAQVRAKSFSEWRQLVEDSHRAASFKGLPDTALDRLASLTGDENGATANLDQAGQHLTHRTSR
jgi:HicB family